MKALSFRQPWAWLILYGVKDIENRTWHTNFRGRVLIHAGKSMTRREYAEGFQALKRVWPELAKNFPEDFRGQQGGIVGEVEIVDCVTTSRSPWFVGPYGFVLRNAKPLPFRPYIGKLGFFEVTP